MITDKYMEKHPLKSRIKRGISILLAGAVVFTFSCPTLAQDSYAAGSFNDISDHWAATYIRSASSLGIINGYRDGSFKPDEPVTRAEFVTMVNNTLGNSLTTANTFNDVSNGSWYFNDICKASAAGYVSGYSDGTFQPNAPVTRQDAAVIISRIVPTYGYTKKLEDYKDYKQIDEYAVQAWQKMCGKGYFGAYDDGLLHPKDNLTRAQTAKIVCTVAGNETIVASTEKVEDSGSKFKDKVFANGMTILDDVGNGSVTVENCVVLGKFTINGGGTSTITVKNSRVANCIIDKDNSAVRLLLSAETYINKASAYENATIETQKITGGLYGCGINNLYIEDDAQTILNGSFQTVTMNGDNADLTLSTGSMENLVVLSGGRGSDITLSEDTKCKSATINATCYLHGSGVISSMLVNARDVAYETRPTTWTIGSNGGVPTLEESGLNVKFSPKSGSTSVPINTTIELTFSSAVFNDDGKKIGTSDIEELVELRQKSKSGTKIEFTSKISSSKKVITLTPENNLSMDTRYYVIIDDDSFFSEDEEELSAQSCYFTTGDNDDMGINFSPDDDDDDVSISKNPTITFDSAIETADGKDITDSYLESAIDFRKTNSSGATVGFSASINSSDKKITINPDSDLTENTQYYLAILKDQLQYKSDESEVEACSVTWKTTYNRPVVSSLTATATENSVNVKATPSMAGTVYIAVTTGTPTTADYKSTSGTANTAVSMDFTGLESGKSYRVSAYVVANTYTSSTKSTTVSTATQKAYLSGISITGEDGRGAETVPEDYSSSDFDSDTFTYSVRMPFGTEMAYVVAAADSGITVKYLENGSYIETDGIPVDLGHATASNYVTATISAEASGMNSSSYNIRFYVAGEPGLDTISVDGDTITHDDTSGPADRRFDVSTGTLPVTIAAKDSEATVTCVELANTSGGTGTLTGDLAISSGETTNLRVTITSNGESKVYLYAVTAR